MQITKRVQFGIIALIVVSVVIVFVDTLSHLPDAERKINNDATSQNTSALASWWLAKAYFAEPNPPEIVILGSSQLSPVQGADSYVYDRAIDITDDHRSYVLEKDFHGLLNKDWRVFIGALPGAMISDQFFMARALFSNDYKPKLVGVTFSPEDFIGRSSPAVTNTEAFNFFSKYTDSKVLRNKLDKMRTEHFQTENFDSQQIRSDSKSKLENEPSLHLGKPFQRISSGDIIIYSGDDQSFKSNIDEYKQRYENPLSPQYETQLTYFNSLLKYLAEQNIKVIAFNLPVSASNKKLLSDDFWRNYTTKISEICQKNGADFVSVDQVVTEFKNDEFIDATHLNLKGGHRLSKTVALFIVNKLGLKTFQELLANDKCLL